MAVRILATGTADTDAIRTETFRNREYTVVPVVGLVEGIIQGLNAAEPEFAPADEFAKFPMGWNGRPCTMNHPRRDGELTSANDPDMLEEFQMGFLAATRRDDTRLKFEAWIDNEVVAEKGGEFQETLDRLTSGEDIVEVSTGLFCEVVSQGGTWNGQRYKKYWTNVVPDHLAFLSLGSIGACSVENGCGAPRLNEVQLRVHGSTVLNGTTELVTTAPLNLGAPPEACCDACAKGEACMATQPGPTPPATPPSPAPAPTPTPPTQPTSPTATNEDSNSSEATTTEENENGERTLGREPGRNEALGELAGNQGNDARRNEDDPVNEEASSLPESITAELESNERAAQILKGLTANAVDPSITLADARQVAQSALRDHLNGAFVYVMAMTTELCAYEVYQEGLGFQTFALNYSIDANGGVTFTGEPVPVNLLVRVVPREVSSPTANEGTSGANQQTEEDTAMAGENQSNQTVETPGTDGEVSANASGAGAQPAPRTLEDSLSTMHPDVAAVVREGIELRTQKRQGLIDKIVANSNGVYSAEDLEGKDLPELEKLEQLSRPVKDFSGRVFPTGRTEGINSNEQRENQRSVPSAPKAFEKKPTSRGGRVTDQPESAAA